MEETGSLLGIAYCGVNCEVCPDYREHRCPSCRKTEWKPDDACLPVRCCQERGIPACAFCKSFPCADMEAFYKESDSHREALDRMICLRKQETGLPE